MNTEILYKDSLIEINDNSIILANYFFPSFSSKIIRFRDIEKIQTLAPTMFNGKWRIMGTGNIRTWFPMDSNRPRRDRIFIIHYKSKWTRTGFTVEDSARVVLLLKQKGILSDLVNV